MGHREHSNRRRGETIEARGRGATALITGIGIGAATAFLLDPDRGRRRRHLIVDQANRTSHRIARTLDATMKDVRNRSTGLVSGTTGLLSAEEAPDQVIEARARSRLGRLTLHAGAIEVSCQDGIVTLRGPVLEQDATRILYGTAGVKGVKEVRNELEIHRNAEGIPDLQGRPSNRQISRARLAERQWNPTARLMSGLMGGGLTLFGIMRGGTMGMVATIGGAGLLARSLTAAPVSRITGIGAGRSAVTVRKHFYIDAPVEVVFDFWSNFENFPRFMEHVLEVHRNDSGQSRWTVRGPASTNISFTTEITSWIDGREIAWKTQPGSPVQHSGIVKFQPEGSGTRLDITMSYNPVLGAIGHAVASFFGVNPKQGLDSDLLRLKSLIEHGKTTAHGETVSYEEVPH